MNKKEILKKVGGILTELNEQFEYLSRSPDNLNELELELFSANANFLSDHLSILVKLNETKAKVKVMEEKGTGVESHQIEQENVVESPLKPEEDTVPDWKLEVEKESGITFEFEEKQTDKLFDQPLTDEEKKVIDEETLLKAGGSEDEEDRADLEVAENNDKEEIQTENFEEANDDIYVKEVIISERTIAVPVEPKAEDIPAQTVNDMLSKSIPQQTVGGQFTSLQPKDLKGMISLNDKLLFVRDLFNGYSLAYSEALELINRFDSFEAAENFLKQNYAVKNNWTNKQDVADKFYEILSRRFAK